MIYHKNLVFHGRWKRTHISWKKNPYVGLNVPFSPISLRIFEMENFLQMKEKLLAALSMGLITIMREGFTNFVENYQK